VDRARRTDGPGEDRARRFDDLFSLVADLEVVAAETPQPHPQGPVRGGDGEVCCAASSRPIRPAMIMLPGGIRARSLALAHED
jgi:hypothetical protein